MGTIVERKRSSGGTAYMAKIVLKRDGKIVHRETKTFDRRPAARGWMQKREDELKEPGAIEAARIGRPKLRDAIDRYIATSARQLGHSKANSLDMVKRDEIADVACEDIRSHHIVEYARRVGRTVKPQTVASRLSHLSTIFTIARPAWGFPLAREEMTGALAVCRRLGITADADKRDRRPTLQELDRLMTWFAEREFRAPSSVPMTRLVAFALFSVRRESEISRLEWRDLEEDHARIIVRDMKHPGETIGNDVWCDLTPEALRIVQALPRTGPRMFPFAATTISTTFTRACRFLGIEDLHFHDLRHDGISRLFEIGWNIPHVATVSGHRTWASLQRYTHIRQRDDKYAGWKWLDIVTKKEAAQGGHSPDMASAV